MYLRHVIRSSSLFGKSPQTVYKTVYTNVAHIVRMQVINKSLCIMESNGNHITYDFTNEENAKKMAERIIACRNATTNCGEYLDIQEEMDKLK